MGGLTIEIAPFLLGAVILGGLIGWLLPGPQGKGRLSRLSGESRTKLHDALTQRDTLTGKVGEMQSSIDTQKAIVRTQEIKTTIAKTELDDAHKKAKSLEHDVFALQAEREDFKFKLTTFRNALIAMKQRSTELQGEFGKIGNFYKGELAKSFEIRGFSGWRNGHELGHRVCPCERDHGDRDHGHQTVETRRASGRPGLNWRLRKERPSNASDRAGGQPRLNEMPIRNVRISNRSRKE